MPVVSLRGPCAGTHPHVSSNERSVWENGGEGTEGWGCHAGSGNSYWVPRWNAGYSIKSSSYLQRSADEAGKCCAQSRSFNPSAGGKSRSVSLSRITFSLIQHPSAGVGKGAKKPPKTGVYSSRWGHRGQVNDLNPEIFRPGSRCPAGTLPEEKHGCDNLQAVPGGIRAPFAEIKR